MRLENKQLQRAVPQHDFNIDLRNKMTTIFAQQQENLLSAYAKYRDYYDKKEKAAPLKLHSYCSILHPLLTTQSDKMPNLKSKFVLLFRVEKVLSYSNYLIRRVGTNYTQIVHRIRLRPIKPHYTVQDFDEIDDQNFIPDPTLKRLSQEPEIFDKPTEELLREPPQRPPQQEQLQQYPIVTISLPLRNNIAPQTSLTSDKPPKTTPCSLLYSSTTRLAPQLTLPARLRHTSLLPAAQITHLQPLTTIKSVWLNHTDRHVSHQYTSRT